MKTATLILAAFVGVQAGAQTTLAPPGAVLQIPPASSAGPGAPAQTATPFIPPGTNSVGTNVLTAQLAQLLLNLQARLEQTLPVLAAFNDSFDFAAPNGGGLLPFAYSTPAGVPSAGVNLATNLATDLSVNFGESLAIPAGISITNLPAPPPALVVPAGMNGFAVFPLTPETMRGMLLLQNDMERLLPILNAVNSGNNLPQ